ncbi:MAG: hypothetical protein LBV30_05640 [Propionibacteriaceae bacterium]|jgi:hypothetical protein|nr:hypothetical protein [Propionibacteriaceae bacterium]
MALADVHSLSTIVSQVLTFRASGASVQVLEAEEQVDGRRCDALSVTGSIVKAAAVRPTDPVRLPVLPSSTINGVEATPQLIDMLAVIAQPVVVDRDVIDGVWLSADVASLLGVAPGDSLLTENGLVAVVAVYQWPDDGRSRDLGFAIVTPVPADGVFSQCWVETWPLDRSVNSLALISLINPTPENSYTLGQLNDSLGADINGAMLLDQRLTDKAAWISAFVGLLLGYGATRMRRLEMVSALHAQIRRVDLLWQQLIEAICWVGASSIVLAAALFGWTLVADVEPLWPIWLTSLRIVLVGSIATVLGVVIGVLSVRQKMLYRFSK